MSERLIKIDFLVCYLLCFVCVCVCVCYSCVFVSVYVSECVWVCVRLWTKLSFVLPLKIGSKCYTTRDKFQTQIFKWRYLLQLLNAHSPSPSSSCPFSVLASRHSPLNEIYKNLTLLHPPFFLPPITTLILSIFEIWKVDPFRGRDSERQSP